VTKSKLQLFTLLVGVATIACVTKSKEAAQSINATPRDQDNHNLSLEVPNAPWEPLFFQTLEARTKKAGIESLRRAALPDHNLEARFWYDHFEIIQGLIIRRSDDTWSATYLRQNDQTPASMQQEALGVPKSGWEGAWARLKTAGILALPDESVTKCDSSVLDGIGYVVETNVDRKYRTYRYDNPQFANCDEAKRILVIENVLSEEFELRPQK
jgi:hypothetical protein